MTEILAVVSDLHITGTTALCKPNLRLDDGGEYSASKGQRFLWRSWLDFWGEVKSLADLNQASVTAVFNGDTVEVDAKRRSSQIVTTNKAKIVEAAAETLEPALDAASRAVFLRGTGAHEGKSSEIVELLGRDITVTEKDGNGNYSWWSFLGEFEGVLFDIEHHGPLGRMPWTATNPLNSLAVRLMLKYSGKRLPQVAVRSHNHRKGDTYDNYPIRVLSTGAWQLETEFTHRMGAVEAADIQGLIFVCQNGEVECVKRQYKPIPSKIWTSQKTT